FSRPEQEGHGLRLRKDHFATVFLPLSSFYAVHSGNAAFPVAEGNSSGSWNVHPCCLTGSPIVFFFL
ncbi:hypothetical protein, partial [Phocaeicola sp.]|uniref:hypothetical protein n=1 Tax=Phocaeicola sp. TaxID=2773926 RepID=UPI00283D18E4